MPTISQSEVAQLKGCNDTPLGQAFVKNRLLIWMLECMEDVEDVTEQDLDRWHDYAKQVDKYLTYQLFTQEAKTPCEK